MTKIAVLKLLFQNNKGITVDQRNLKTLMTEYIKLSMVKH